MNSAQSFPSVLPAHATRLRLLSPFPISTNPWEDGFPVSDGADYAGGNRPAPPAQDSPFEAVYPAQMTVSARMAATARTEQPRLDGGSHELEIPGTEIEAIIRQATRRVLAEHHPVAGPFDRPGFGTSFVWSLLALLTGRSYADVAFEKTRGFRVEEIYLFGTLPEQVLLSFASRDPARHRSRRRITPLADRLLRELERQQPEDGAILAGFGPPVATVWRSPASTMVIFQRGKPGSRNLEDLRFVQTRVDRALSGGGPGGGCEPAIWHLQSLLEDALLIYNPVPAW